MKITITELKCKRCGWHWYPKSEKMPTVCPKCKSPYWFKDKKENNK